MNLLIFMCLSNFLYIVYSQDFCTWKNSVTGQSWKLVWKENFDSDVVNKQIWKIANHEEDSQFCDCKY